MAHKKQAKEKELKKQIRQLKAAIQDLLDSEDNEGCSDDLTVVSSLTVRELRGLMGEDVACPRCDADGEEPGSPISEDGRKALCSRCKGSGEFTIPRE